MSSLENVDFELFPPKRNSHYSSAPILIRLGINMQKKYRCVEYIPVKCFNKSMQSAVNARRETDESPSSSVVAVTMKCLPTAPTAIILWIVVATLSQTT